MEMGFPLEDARQALQGCDWDPNKALDSLISGEFQPKPKPSVPAVASEGGDGSPAKAGASGAALKVPGDQNRAEAEASIKNMLGLAPPSQPAGGTSPDRSTAASECESSPRSPPLQAQAAAPAAAALAPVMPPTPNRRLARVQLGWSQEDWSSTNQLNVEKDDLVMAWSDSVTGMGWIYAEHVKENGGSGWLPLAAIGEDTYLQQQQQQLLSPVAASPALMAQPITPPQQLLAQPPVPPVVQAPMVCWMRAKQACGATYDSQLPVQAGTPLLVHTDKVSADNNWVFAEAFDAGARAPPGCGVGPVAASRAGWVPVICLDWPGSR